MALHRGPAAAGDARQTQDQQKNPHRRKAEEKDEDRDPGEQIPVVPVLAGAIGAVGLARVRHMGSLRIER